MIKKLVFFALIIVVAMYTSTSCSQKTHDIEAAVASLNTDELAHDVEILGSDEFEGRFPASPGEEKTINFLKEEFEKVGLKPGNGRQLFSGSPTGRDHSQPRDKTGDHRRGTSHWNLPSLMIL